jgi:hypothetical protein
MFKKKPQPGRQGILNLFKAVLLETLVQPGHKVKNISETVSLYILSPRVLSLFFLWLDCFLQWYYFPHASSKISAKSEL